MTRPSTTHTATRPRHLSSPPRQRWQVLALACLALTLASFDGPAGADERRWQPPPPRPSHPDQMQGHDHGWAPSHLTPRFQPPSASHCRRPPVAREVAGLDPQVQRAGDAPPFRHRRGASTDLRSRPEPAGSVDAASASESAAAPLPSTAPAPASGDALAHGDARHSAVERAQRRAEVVTAGMVDDNADFGAYLRFRERHRGLPVRDRDVSERYMLEVRDAQGRAVHDAEVAMGLPGAQAPLMWARTDTAGRVWLHPRAVLPHEGTWSRDTQAPRLQVQVWHQGAQAQAWLTRGQKHALQVRLAPAHAMTHAAQDIGTRLDLVFMIDATGSMSDEIHKLRSTMRAIADQIAALPSRPDVCFGLVAYRDHGDAFVTRSHDLTDDLDAFQHVLAGLHAAGGGDYPEAVDEALHETVHGLSWRDSGATRLVVLLGDAPPHVRSRGPAYEVDMQAALAKGIKLFTVGASGLDRRGEYVFRQMAQYTGGSFVFLTYRDARRPGSGPGNQTVHDVDQYSVDTLDRLIVRLVTQELAPLTMHLTGRAQR